VSAGDGLQNLQPLGLAGNAAHLSLAPTATPSKQSTSVTLFDQGLIQVVQASVTGLEPKKPYLLGLAADPNGAGETQPLAAFMSNPAGSAIVNALGPIRQIVQGEAKTERRYFVITEGTVAQPGRVVQLHAR